jgi:predicted phosphoribosyltransferase
MRFRDREEAAAELARRLRRYHTHRPLVLGVPRAGVPMARLVAEAIDGDFDVVLVRSLRAPGYPEIVIGATDEDGRILRPPHFGGLVPSEYLRSEVRLQQQALRECRMTYNRHRPPYDRAGRMVIIVDEGSATGTTLLAAIHSVRAHRPAAIIAAVAVAPADVLRQLRAEVDDVICLWAPDAVVAVGDFFDDFPEVTDTMVAAALSRHEAAGAATS